LGVIAALQNAHRGRDGQRSFLLETIMNKMSKLRAEAQHCIRVANRTVDNKVAAAILAYACELEQRARVIENSKKPIQKSPR